MWVLFAAVMAMGQVPPETDAKARAAEVRRLSQEVQRHAKENRFAGVERDYARVIQLTSDVDPILHVYAAQAAQGRGDALMALARFQRVPEGSEASLVAAESFNSLVQRYAFVRISAVAGVDMTGPVPFSPSEASAVRFAIEQLKAHGWYLGLLPVGQYVIPGVDRTATFFNGGGSYDVVTP